MYIIGLLIVIIILLATNTYIIMVMGIQINTIPVLMVAVIGVLINNYLKKSSVTSLLDGFAYKVYQLEDKQEAADTLAEINRRVVVLMKHLRAGYGDDYRTQLLLSRYQIDKIVENIPSLMKHTSYTQNKGEKIAICLRNPDSKIHDINTLMFVVLHELGHVATNSYGHNQEFWIAFKWLLERAVEVNIYIPIDYSQRPVNYCSGQNITSNPLFIPI
jgi:hypothetical protein